MANEKILILESPWSDEIDRTQSTREIYTSAETLLRLGPRPVRIIQRPLVSSLYLDDIRNFVGLKCNKNRPNIIIFSAHGSKKLTRKNRIRRTLTAFDRDVNISRDIRTLNGVLDRSIIILDACGVGDHIESFRRAAGALAVIGFKEDVDWIDSSVFVLAFLLYIHHYDVLVKKSKGNKRLLKAMKDMLTGAYKSFREPLGIEYSVAKNEED